MGRIFEKRKHSIWKTAASNSKLYSKYSKQLYMAAKNGVPDPAANPVLRNFVEKAAPVKGCGSSYAPISPRTGSRSALTVPRPSADDPLNGVECFILMARHDVQKSARCRNTRGMAQPFRDDLNRPSGPPEGGLPHNAGDRPA